MRQDILPTIIYQLPNLVGLLSVVPMEALVWCSGSLQFVDDSKHMVRLASYPTFLRQECCDSLFHSSDKAKTKLHNIAEPRTGLSQMDE